MVGFRFDPPDYQPMPEMSWILGAAFGQVVHGCPGLVDIGALVAAGDVLGLLPRIGARIGCDVIAGSAGKEIAGLILDRTRAAAAHGLIVRAMAARVGKIAHAVGIDAVIIKGGALLLQGAVPAGARNVGDLDVLVSRGRAGQLQQALVEAGWVASDLPSSPHQLPILGHRSGVPVEVHVFMPGVRLGEGDATAEDVIVSGRCRSSDLLPEGCWMVDGELLLAHLIVHGIHQHGFAPGIYPIARMLADVQDLVPGQIEWERFLDHGFGWINHVVTRREAEAVWAIVDRLGRGKDPASVMEGDDDAGRLLRHIVAGAVDEEYRKSLKVRDAARAIHDSSWFEAGKKAIFLTRGQIDTIYGTPVGEVGYWGRRLWRPFDLVLRTARYGWAWMRQRWMRGTKLGTDRPQDESR